MVLLRILEKELFQLLLSMVLILLVFSDLMLEMKPKGDLKGLQYVSLVQDLEDEFNCHVDVVSKGSSK